MNTTLKDSSDWSAAVLAGTTENRSELVNIQGGLRPWLLAKGTLQHPSIAEALRNVSAAADTLAVTFFPELNEHVIILAELRRTPLLRIVFRQPSRNNTFFLSDDAHNWLDAYHRLGIQVYWFDERRAELYVHTYKREQGFFIREERARQFESARIVAFYGSAVSLDAMEAARISTLVEKLAQFIGPPFAVLTGGGPGVMGLAMERARERNALTGACFLELEAQPPVHGVDFFNTFSETSRHNRQKWFQVAELCIFNVGGIGTLEEAGIELCNLKLGIRPRTPYVFMNSDFWRHLRAQLDEMVQTHRAPAWMLDYVLFTDEPDEVLRFYQCMLSGDAGGCSEDRS